MMKLIETNNIFRNLSTGDDSLFYIDDASVAEIQKVLVLIMDDIDEVCEKYGLSYSLCGGSALGAVRHAGFIPWDDDMDIMLPRKDYDKLAEIFELEHSDRYWVQNIKFDNKYDLNFMKIRLKGTKCVELLESEPDKAGIFVDVYPLECTYPDALRRNLHGILDDVLLFICSCVRLSSKRNIFLRYIQKRKERVVVLIKSGIGIVFSAISLNSWLNITEETLSLCNSERGTYYSIPSGRRHYFGEMYRKDGLFPTQKIEFSGRKYSIMNDYREYLTKLYGGDYMNIPPSQKREKHLLIDLKLPNSEDK